MNKKFYEAPSMEQIKLSHFSALLDGSNPSGNDPVWGDGPEPDPEQPGVF